MAGMLQAVVLSMCFFVNAQAESFNLKTDLYGEFSNARLKKMIFPGLHANLSREILRLDPNQGFVKKETFLNYIKDVESFKKCLLALNNCRLYLQTLPKEEWVRIVDDFHRDLARRLALMDVPQRRIRISMGQSLGYMTNVACSPDKEVSVSHQSSPLGISDLGVVVQTRDFPWGIYGMFANARYEKYLDKEVNDRDLVATDFGMDAQMKLGGKISAVDASLEYGMDLFDTSQDGVARALDHVMPGFVVTYREFGNWRTKTIMNMDLRSYQKDKMNALNQSRNTNVTRLGQEFVCRFGEDGNIHDMEFIIGIEDRSSAAEETNYQSVFMESLVTFACHGVEVKPYVDFKTRSGTTHLLLTERNDLQTKIGLKALRKLEGTPVSAGFDLFRENNHSNISAYEYYNSGCFVSLQASW